MVVGEQAAVDLERLLLQRLCLRVLPLGVEVESDVVEAGGGVGVVVGEQAAVDLERLVEQRLGLGVLPLGVERVCEPPVATGGLEIVVGEQAALDLNRLLEERLGLGVLPLAVEGFRLLNRGLRRSVGDSIVHWHRGYPAQRLETQLLVHCFEVRRSLHSRRKASSSSALAIASSQRSAFSAASMALSSASARLASSPDNFSNPGAVDCASFGVVVWAIVGKPGNTIANPISSPNRYTTRRAIMMGLIA